jgi:hypothetical protein
MQSWLAARKRKKEKGKKNEKKNQGLRGEEE